jgi:hypothetical protein
VAKKAISKLFQYGIGLQFYWKTTEVHEQAKDRFIIMLDQFG